MKKRRKIKLKYKKDRVLLSDVLPYELPIIMSNRALYRFCVKNKIRYDISSNILSWDKNIDSDTFEVLKIIFRPAFNNSTPLPNVSDGQVNLLNYSTIPFVFHIFHKETEFRALSLVHPAMQIGMVEFYNQFKSLIIHYCTRSRYSIRYPQKVASFFYYKDKLHHKLLGTKKDNIELFFNEYENLKTFFSYKKYTQIYRFYDDYRFQRAEKRFEHLLRFDIQKCFDSIYTHTIAWATQGGKSAYKKEFDGRDKTSFGGIFDTVMQRLNYNETNGIVIGPEFSRIFAEIILQHIDRCVEYHLDHLNIKNGIDYQLYRYVDDYFLFYKDEYVKNKVLDLFSRNLEEYKLKISREKTKDYLSPFLTEISRAKMRIDKLIKNHLKFESSSFEVDDFDGGDEKDTADEEIVIEDAKFVPDEAKLQKLLNCDGYYPMNSLRFNQEFKDILISTGVKAKDVLNYTLSAIATRVERELRKFDEQYRYLKLTSRCKGSIPDDKWDHCNQKLKTLESKLTKYLREVVESCFFLLSLNRRLNSTLKICRVLNSIIIFLNGEIRWGGKQVCHRFSKHIRYLIFSIIQYEVVDILRRSKCHDYAQLEVLYLLIIMRMLDTTHPIPEEILIENLELGNKDRHQKLNVIAINVILYYIGNKSRYSNLKRLLIDNILQAIKDKEIIDFHKDTESVLMVLDIACCPYLEKTQKERIFNELRLTPEEINGILSFGRKQKCFLTKWKGVDITKELAAKISQEVYS